MTILPDTIRILCYGDSNTWGREPQGDRYAAAARWTGVLQRELGNDYEIIEEGLVKRTTNLDDPDFVGKNGKTYLVPCLESQNPIDVVILMLGTNDLKQKYNRTPAQVGEAIGELIALTKQYGKSSAQQTPHILLLSPPFVDEHFAQPEFLEAEVKSRALAAELAQVAQKNSCSFIDIGQIVLPSQRDGIHLEPEMHEKIGERLADELRVLAKRPPQNDI